MTEQVARKARPLNFVHNDEIWKDHVRHEIMSQRQKWPETWGFIVPEYDVLNRCLEEGRLITPPRPSSRKFDGIKLPPIEKPKPPSPTFPMTTSREIGWRTLKKDGTIETYWNYSGKAKGKMGIFKLLKWPPQCAP